MVKPAGLDGYRWLRLHHNRRMALCNTAIPLMVPAPLFLPFVLQGYRTTGRITEENYIVVLH